MAFRIALRAERQHERACVSRPVASQCGAELMEARSRRRPLPGERRKDEPPQTKIPQFGRTCAPACAGFVKAEDGGRAGRGLRLSPQGPGPRARSLGRAVRPHHRCRKFVAVRELERWLEQVAGRMRAPRGYSAHNAGADSAPHAVPVNGDLGAGHERQRHRDDDAACCASRAEATTRR